jgi:hypothetical protein
MPSGCSIVTNIDPATQPANLTTPGFGARIAVPNGTAMSIPRWPAPYGDEGCSNGWMTGPRTGHPYVPTSTDAMAGFVPARTSTAKTETAAPVHLRNVPTETPSSLPAPVGVPSKIDRDPRSVQ